MKILFLSRWFPFPQDNGSKIRVHNLLTELSKYHEITLLSFIDPSAFDTTNISAYQNLSGVEVVPWKPYRAGSSKALLGFFKAAPRFILDTYSPEMEGLIRKHLTQSNFDLVIASQLSMASYFACFQGIPAIFEELEMGLFYGQAKDSQGFLKRFRHHLTWHKLRRYISQLLDHFQWCTVVSDQERALFLQHFLEHRNKIGILPNCVRMQDYEHLEVDRKPNQIIFTGSFQYHANYEAMLWFVQSVFPVVLEQLPDVHLIITGDHANQTLPFEKNITFSGYVEDIRPWVAASQVSIAPLLSGGGTRLKILEAMAIGIPVVATSKGAEGLDVLAGEHLLIADSGQAFADQIIRLLRDKDLRHRLVVKAKNLVKEKYNWEAVIARFLEAAAQVSVN